MGCLTYQSMLECTKGAKMVKDYTRMPRSTEFVLMQSHEFTVAGFKGTFFLQKGYDSLPEKFAQAQMCETCVRDGVIYTIYHLVLA